MRSCYNETSYPLQRKGCIMAKRKKTSEPIAQQIEQFEAENPAIAEAMRVFDISIEEYQRALRAMYTPQTYTSTSTVRITGEVIHGELGSG
jgi:hypothetical protein